MRRMTHGCKHQRLDDFKMHATGRAPSKDTQANNQPLPRNLSLKREKPHQPWICSHKQLPANQVIEDVEPHHALAELGAEGRALEVVLEIDHQLELVQQAWQLQEVVQQLARDPTLLFMPQYTHELV